MAAQPLGQMLMAARLIDQVQLEAALADQSKEGGRLGSSLTRLGIVDEPTIGSFLSQQMGVPSIDLREVDVDPAILKLVPAKTAKRYKLVPVGRNGATLHLAMAEPTNVHAQDDIKFVTGYSVEPLVAPEKAIDDAIVRFYDSGGFGSGKAAINTDEFSLTDEDDVSSFEGELEAGPMLDVDEFDNLVQGAVDNVELLEDDDEDVLKIDIDAPIVKLVNGILIKAYKLKASDIHIEPYERIMRVRYRLDGVCKTMMNLPIKIKNPVVSRIKIMSRLDIAERRVPQDGRIKMKLGRRAQVDFRVSVIPGMFGEKVVLRLLDKSTLQLDMTKLGFEEGALADFQGGIRKPCGMVLVTGPTGSGKTTTLYSALADLNREEVNIMTAEDPVEFNLMGINQIQTRPEVGLSFASALRSFLRQDPDIVLVGEIRDLETAGISVKAALTGHLVLSTLHTNDAPTAVTRLVNMGVEPFLVAYSVNLVVAQRLARRVCQSCKEKVDVSPKTLAQMGLDQEDAKSTVCYAGAGCNQCRGTGYSGRVALYEVMPITDEIRDLILAGDTGQQIGRSAVRNGMKTLRMSGLTKLAEGLTTVEEVMRITF